MIYRWLSSCLILFWLMFVSSRSGLCSVSGSVQEGTEHKKEDVALPSNIVMPKDLKPILLRMIERSPTFRSQCQKIDSASYLRITIEIVPRLSDCQCRALSKVKRYSDGLVMIKVQIIVPNIHIVEVIGHEFEHALEQIEGLDLRALASTQSEYVYKADGGSFETKRAIRAGNVIEQEVYFFRNSHPGILTKNEGLSQR